MERESTPVTVFAVINFALAGVGLLALVTISMTAVYGVFYSGDEGSDKAAGVLGSAFIGLFLVAGVVCYLATGIGLLKRKLWGYYFFIAGAVLSVTSCCCVPYAVAALIYAFKPEFKDQFS